ncbi:MAG: hypothetical protein AAFO29_22270 [Actinomycetota bacterium]
MKPETETRIIRVLQAAIALMLLGIVLNVPHPNGQGGIRDQFVEGWRLAREADDQAPVEAPATTVPGIAPSGADR